MLVVSGPDGQRQSAEADARTCVITGNKNGFRSIRKAMDLGRSASVARGHPAASAPAEFADRRP